MIQADGCNHGRVRIDGIHGVKPAAEANFENHNVGTAAHEEKQNREAGEFKISELQARALFLNRAERLNERLVRRFAPVNERSLIEAKDMGRCVQRRMHAGFAADRLKKRAGRALPVRACHRYDGAVEANAEPFDHFPHALKAEHHRLFVNRLHICEPLRKRAFLFHQHVQK